MPCVQENVLKESEMMIPETKQRLEAALGDLQAYLVRPQSACCSTWHGSCIRLAQVLNAMMLNACLTSETYVECPWVHRDPCSLQQGDVRAG